MERGLLWLPLLIVIAWLTWSGWNEYQKVEAYRRWAQDFDQAKYDIYTVLGQKGQQITWGYPTRSQPLNLQTFSLEEVTEIRLLVGDRPVDLDSLPNKGKAVLAFSFLDQRPPTIIPFTQIDLAAQWVNYLNKLKTLC